MSATEDSSTTVNSATTAPPESSLALLEKMKQFKASTELGQLLTKRSLDESDNPVYLCVKYDRFDAEDVSHIESVRQDRSRLHRDLSDDQMAQVLGHLTDVSARSADNSRILARCLTRCNEKTVKEFRDAFGLDSGPSVSRVKSSPTSQDEPFSSLGVLKLGDLENLDTIVAILAAR